MSKIIGQRLREIRKEKGYTQKDIAKILHCTQANIAALETGKRNMTYPTAYVLSHELRCNIECLLNDSVEKKDIVWNYEAGFNVGYEKGMQDIKRFITEVLNEQNNN